MLTLAQKQALRAAIVAEPAWNGFLTNPDPDIRIANAETIAAEFNATDATFTVWKTNVSIREIGDNIVGNDLAGLSSLNNTRLQTAVVLASQGVNPSLADRRFFFDDIFSGAGGAATRAKLLILWKRLATRAEKLFANTAGGNGANATPATLTFEGTITPNDVTDAWEFGA